MERVQARPIQAYIYPPERSPTSDGLLFVRLISDGNKVAYDRRHVLSACDPTRKYTLGCYSCLAVILAGTACGNGEEISILAHLPPFIIDEDAASFQQDFQDVLTTLAACSTKESRAVGIVGGFYDYFELFTREYYRLMVELVDSQTRAHLGVEARVLAGPKRRWGESTDIYYDTPTRMAYVIQFDQTLPGCRMPFWASDVGRVQAFWASSPLKENELRKSL